MVATLGGESASDSGAKAFTLLELLVVIGIIGVLAALLLPALSRGKAQAQSAACKNHLRQIGVALGMYVTDFGRYPSSNDWEARQVWMDKLHPYYPLSWTNRSWNCPTYMAKHGMAIFWATNTLEPRAGARWWTSYAYNNNGILGNG